MIKAHYEKHVLQLTKQTQEIMMQCGIENLLIHSGSIHYTFLDDREIPFKANPLFTYFSPLQNHPDSFIYLKQTGIPILYYYKTTDYWYVEAEEPHGFWVDAFNIKIINKFDEFKTDLNLDKTAIISPSMHKFAHLNFKQINPTDIITMIHFNRAEKTDYELYCMREATRIGVKAQLAARAAYYSGLSEYEINDAFYRADLSTYLDMPYNNIIAVNKNGAILHYNHLDRHSLAEDSRYSFLIDAGGLYNGYASDITRTYSYKKTDEFQALIVAMNAMQLELVAELKLETPYTQNQISSHLKLAKILKDFKFVDMEAEEMVEKKVTTAFYPHGVGHFLGIQVHDVGGYQKDTKGTQVSPPAEHPYLRLTRIIKERHVFTIEPGLYFINSLLEKLKASDSSKFVHWSKVEAFKKFGGIRIEDNICMWNNKIENMTRTEFAKQENS